MKAKLKMATMANRREQPDYPVINAALEKYLDLVWTSENQKAIKREVGVGNYLKIEEIISFTSNQDAWLNDYNVSSAADKVGGKLSQHYSMLSSLAVFRVISQATHGWH
jgi:hypothetical protein